LHQGCEGYILNSQDCDIEWKYLDFDISYNVNEVKRNILHLKINISWPSCKAEGENAKKIPCCIKDCVKTAFGVNFDNG
jgi:hypothetical protein